MYRTGVYFGRFLPPHRGHLYQMIKASTRCEKRWWSSPTTPTRPARSAAGTFRNLLPPAQAMDFPADSGHYPHWCTGIGRDGYSCLSTGMGTVEPAHARGGGGDHRNAFFVGDTGIRRNAGGISPNQRSCCLTPPARAIPSPQISAAISWATGIIFWALRASLAAKSAHRRHGKAAEKPR